MIEHTPSRDGKPRYYSSELPLLPDYDARLKTNDEQDIKSNLFLLKRLSKDPEEMENVRKSFNDLIEKGFVINLKDLPENERIAI